MGFLDELLTGARERRVKAQRGLLEAETHVASMDETGIQFAVPDRRVSTALARNVVQDVMGAVPDGMNYRGGPRQDFGFGQTGGDTYKFLRGSGIGVGSTGSELQNAFDSYAPAPLPARPAMSSSPLASGRSGVGYPMRTAQAGMEPAGTATGASYDKDASRTSMTGGYMQGYQGQRDTLLDMNQMSNFIDIQQSLMQRILRSAMFGDYN